MTTAVTACGTLFVGILLWASGAFTLIQEWGGHGSPAKVAVLAVAFVVQLAAPRWPAASIAAMLVLVAVDLPSGISLPLWIALTDVIFAVMSVGSSRLRRAVGFGSVSVTIGAAAVVAVAVDPRAGVLAGLLGVAFLISPLGYAQSVISSVRAAKAEHLAAEAERTAGIAEERRRVSRELHDTVAGHVSAIAILTEAARNVKDPQPMIASMRSNSLAALTELREMIDLLAADTIENADDEPGQTVDAAARVRWSSLTPMITAAEAVGSKVTVLGNPTHLTVAAETVLTRIVGEALANASQHAPGQPIEVRLESDDGSVWVSVTNELNAPHRVNDSRRRGDGRKGKGRRGNGLRNMKIRAESLGGTVTAVADHDRWIVRADIPMRRR
ncbi:MAG: histidine kinase [Gordonia sp. (in: high G+C Gram-positive bacteria)]|uniref:sensor histidine kinase n=1 Tax=Gordonia sp. (in: high G+C Gram-positive bacteria) TaxID=84139 RepID=UPI003C7193E7